MMVRYLAALVAACMLVVAGSAGANGYTPLKQNMTLGGTPAAPRTFNGAPKWIDDIKGNVSGLHLHDCQVVATQKGIALSKSSNILIENCDFTQPAPFKNSGVPGGIWFNSGGNATLRNVSSHGWDTIADGKYPQGDGIYGEYDWRGLRIEGYHGYDNRDGCIDLKVREVTATRLLLERCGRNARIWWATWTVDDFESVDPRSSHIWMSSALSESSGRWKEAGLVVRKTFTVKADTAAPVFYIEHEKGTIDLSTAICFFAVPPRTPMFKYVNGGAARTTSIKLSPSCQPDAQGYVVNTPIATVPAGVDLGEVLADKDGDGRIELSSKTADRLKLPRGTVLKPLGGTRYQVVE